MKKVLCIGGASHGQLVETQEGARHLICPKAMDVNVVFTPDDFLDMYTGDPSMNTMYESYNYLPFRFLYNEHDNHNYPEIFIHESLDPSEGFYYLLTHYNGAKSTEQYERVKEQNERLSAENSKLKQAIATLTGVWKGL